MLLFSNQSFFFDKMISKLMHIRHHEMCLVSPFIDLSYLSPSHQFGRFLMRATDEQTKIMLLTRPPLKQDFPVFEQLAAANITCGFLDELHSKVYMFDVDEAALGPYTKGTKRAAILGSANMTERGWGLTSTVRNDEISYLLPDSEYGRVRRYVETLRLRSQELSALRMRAARGVGWNQNGGRNAR